MTLVSLPSSPNPARRLIRLCAMFCLELLLLAAAYQFFVVIECHLTDVNGACRFLRSLVARALVVFAVGGLLLWAMPMLRHAVLRAAGQRAGALWPGVHAVGLVLLVLPLAMAPGGNLGAVFDVAIWFLGAGAILAGVGGDVGGPCRGVARHCPGWAGDCAGSVDLSRPSARYRGSGASTLEP